MRLHGLFRVVGDEAAHVHPAVLQLVQVLLGLRQPLLRVLLGDLVA